MASNTIHQRPLPPTAGAVTILTCRIGRRRFALPASSVERIVPMAALTPLAEAPPGVAGLLNIRGELLPVLDPRVRLDLPTPPIQPDQQLILISAHTRFLLWIDRVEEFTQAPAVAVDGPESPGQGRLLPSVVCIEGEAVPVLSPQELDPGMLLRPEGEGRT
jgi:purine-binding chemotaxis protein CheW